MTSSTEISTVWESGMNGVTLAAFNVEVIAKRLPMIYLPKYGSFHLQPAASFS
jgi:hypothetical protein